MSILLWLLPSSGLTVVGILVFLWKKGSWVRNQLPYARKLKKYEKLCQAEADHLALLKSLIDEIEDGCIQETLACLKDMRVTSDLATEQILSSLRQRLYRVIRRINNEVAVAQTLHNRSIRKLEDE